jgi:hypothetical protein
MCENLRALNLNNQSELADVYNAFSLWLDEPRLLHSDILLESFDVSLKPFLLKECIEVGFFLDENSWRGFMLDQEAVPSSISDIAPVNNLVGQESFSVEAGCDLPNIVLRKPLVQNIDMMTLDDAKNILRQDSTLLVFFYFTY